jgi:hypothetical protein
MEQQRAVLLQAIEALERIEIPYAVTGSWASTSYGLPRTTHDLDLVVAITVEQADELASAFQSPMYADAAWMKEAAAKRTFFNIIDPISGLKIDFWPLQDDEYSRTQFERRRHIELLGHKVWMLAPEDVILSKLLWYRASESQTQLRDCIAVWKLQQGAMEPGYLQHWADHLGVTDLLAQVQAG